MKNWIYLIFLLAGPGICAQAPVASGKIPFQVPRDSSVLLLPVFLQYEDIYTDNPLDPAKHKGRESGKIFDSLAIQNLTQAGIRAFMADPADSLQGSLIAAGKNLLRPVTPAALRTSIAEVARNARCRYVLACSFRVKVGPGGYWDPNSGAIGSNASYARFHVSLLDPYTTDGKPCWTQDVELRKLPQPDSKRFSEAVQLLFQLLK
ncbi:MAG: hypothetical protein IPJ82_24545 [Lewinellaceae bacterium]|nr:hypothetical protein [Lewinellaceae bacterium]